MRSKASSYSSKFNPLQHLIRETFRSLWWLPTITTAALVLFMPIMNFLMGNTEYIRLYRSPNTRLMYSLYPKEAAPAISLAVLITAIIIAFVCYYFLFSKRMTAGMLITGVSRKKLFAVRYLYGLFSVIVSILVALAVSAAMNITPFGISKMLPRSLVNIGLILFAIAVISYSISVLAATLSGSAAGFAVSSLTLCFSPNLILMFITNVTGRFFFGSFSSVRAYTLEYDEYLSFAQKYSFLCPSKAFNDKLASLSECTFKGDFPQWLIAEYTPNYFVIIAMIIVSILLFVLSLYLFTKREAEFSGSRSLNSGLIYLIALVIALPIASIIFKSTVGGILSLLIFALICSLVYFVIVAAVTGKLKQKASLTVLASTVIGCCLFSIILYTGGFGYADYIPDITDIASVSMSYVGAPQNVTVNSKLSQVNTDYMSENFEFMITPYYASSTKPSNFVEITDEKDITKVTEIHSLILENKTRKIDYNSADPAVYADISLTYKLKNGAEIVRFYPCLRLSAIDAMLELDETNAYREAFSRQNLLSRFSVEDSINGKSANYPERYEFALFDPMLSVRTLLELDSESKIKLSEAIVADKSVESAQSRYYPSEECLGVIASYNVFDGAITDKRIHNPPDSVDTKFIYVYAEDKNILSWVSENGYSFNSDYNVTAVCEYEWTVDAKGSNNFDKYALCRIYQTPYDNDWTERLTKIRDLTEDEFEEEINRSRLMYSTLRGGSMLKITYERSDGSVGVTVKWLP